MKIAQKATLMRQLNAQSAEQSLNGLMRCLYAESYLCGVLILAVDTLNSIMTFHKLEQLAERMLDV
jgi:hypothetical protein